MTNSGLTWIKFERCINAQLGEVYALEEIKDILNNFGSFSVLFHGAEIRLSGYLLYREGDVVLECDMNEKLKDFIGNHDYHQVCGQIAGRSVTLLNCYIIQRFRFGTDYSKGKFVLSPDRIVIGKAQHEEFKVAKISTTLVPLNYMFSSWAFEECIGFKKDKPALVEYTFPEPVVAYDADGKLTIQRSLSCQTSRQEFTVTSIPMIEFIFNSPTEVNTAIAKLASVRNLFAYFADYYLPIGDLSFNEHFDDEKGTDYLIYCNFEEDTKPKEKPFLITSSMFENQFQSIWNRWQTFYKESKQITALFYEMVCYRSTRTNRFLNLCQCLEVFSDRYRSEESKMVREKYAPTTEKNSAAFMNWITTISPLVVQTFNLSEDKAEEFLDLAKNQHPFITEKKIVTLKHRLEDLFLYLNKYLLLSEEKCIELADTISKARNYFTHYSKDRKEPSFECITCANEFLHFILLLVVYDWLGISKEAIIECTKRTYYGNMDLTAIKLK